MSIKCPQCHFENPPDTDYCGKCAALLKGTDEAAISHTKTLQVPMKELALGSTFAGRYQILEELGRGGMGVVYKAEDTKLKRTVALKFLPPELTHISEVKERFMREAQAAAALDHHHICTVYEFDEAEEKTFISMAYVEGQSLKKKIEKGHLHLDESMNIAIQVAEGLQEAHKKGVVHRDIKSANIMVDERNQAKIMDFGLARVAGGTLVTKEGMTMGTIAYMSPEQARGETVDHQTDIWSLGVVLYELLAGQLPFRGEHDQAIVYSILNEDPKPVSEIRSEIPKTLEQVVDKALERNPDERYQNIDELLDDLKSVAVGLEPKKLRTRLWKTKLPRIKRAFLYGGIVGLIIIITLIIQTLFIGRAEAIDSIAVLPLQNLSGDPEQEYFSDGVTDALINELTKISALRVISRTSLMPYKQIQKSIPEIAKELNIDVVVEASVLTAGDKVQIRAQLIEAPTEKNLWTQSYEREISDILALQSEIAQTIAQEIKAKLTPEEKARFVSAQRVDPEVYNAYLKGRYCAEKNTREEYFESIRFFRQALDKDPGFAPAWAMLSLSYIWIGNYGFQPPSEVFPLAKAAAFRARELDDSIAETHLAMIAVRWSIERNFPEAEKEIIRALEINPNSFLANDFYAQYLSLRGRHDEAIEHINKAWELNPLFTREAYFVARILYFAGKYDEAIEKCKKLLEMDPEYPSAHWLLSLISLQKGEYEKATEEMQTANDKRGGYGEIYMPPYLYARAGRREEAQKMLEDLLERSKQRYVPNASIALIYSALGNKDKAFEYLDKAYEAYDSWLFQLHDPVWDLLRDDPRFKALLKKMGLED